MAVEPPSKAGPSGSSDSAPKQGPLHNSGVSEKFHQGGDRSRVLSGTDETRLAERAFEEGGASAGVTTASPSAAQHSEIKGLGLQVFLAAHRNASQQQDSP